VIEEIVSGRASSLEVKDVNSCEINDLVKALQDKLPDDMATEIKGAVIGETSTVSNRHDKYAAFDVPFSGDAKSPPTKFAVGHNIQLTHIPTPASIYSVFCTDQVITV